MEVHTNLPGFRYAMASIGVLFHTSWIPTRLIELSRGPDQWKGSKIGVWIGSLTEGWQNYPECEPYVVTCLNETP